MISELELESGLKTTGMFVEVSYYGTVKSLGCQSDSSKLCNHLEPGFLIVNSVNSYLSDQYLLKILQKSHKVKFFGYLTQCLTVLHFQL